MFTLPDSIRLIAFDWDGTLFDSTALIALCLQEAVVDVGGARPSDDRARHVIGLGLQEALQQAAPDVPPERYRVLTERYRVLTERYRYHYARHMDDILLFKGVPELLHDLHRAGYLLAVATGKSRRGLDEALRAVQLQHLFDATRTADETASKPDPLMLFELMEELDVSAAQTLMVGDTSHDLLMARQAGCLGVAVTYGAHDSVSLAQLDPLFTAGSVPELRRWLLPGAIPADRSHAGL